MEVAVEDVQEVDVAADAGVAARDLGAPDAVRVLLVLDQGSVEVREADESGGVAVAFMNSFGEADDNELLVLVCLLSQEIAQDLLLQLLNVVREVDLVDLAQRVGAAAEEEEVFESVDRHSELLLVQCDSLSGVMAAPLHESDNLLSVGEPRVAQGEVDCMDQAVVCILRERLAHVREHCVRLEVVLVPYVLAVEDPVVVVAVIIEDAGDRVALLFFDL